MLHVGSASNNRQVALKCICLLCCVQVPSVGEYGLEIYASDPETDGQSMFHVYQYMIVCSNLHGDPPAPYPALPMNYLGPQPGFQSLGLTLDVDDPYQVSPVSGCIATQSIGCGPLLPVSCVCVCVDHNCEMY